MLNASKQNRKIAKPEINQEGCRPRLHYSSANWPKAKLVMLWLGQAQEAHKKAAVTTREAAEKRQRSSLLLQLKKLPP